MRFAALRRPISLSSFHEEDAARLQSFDARLYMHAHHNTWLSLAATAGHGPFDYYARQAYMMTLRGLFSRLPLYYQRNLSCHVYYRRACTTLAGRSRAHFSRPPEEILMPSSYFLKYHAIHNIFAMMMMKYFRRAICHISYIPGHYCCAAL